MTVGSVSASASYGASSNSTTAAVAQALSQALNQTSSCTSTYSGSTVSVAWKTPGIAGNNISVTSSVSWDSADFSGPSFSACSGSASCTLNPLSGGQAPYPSGITHPYVTLYTYDVLGNLLGVKQEGGTTDQTQWRVRSFTYDSLSRLLTATNPESGTISYSYDANGNLLQKTSPAPNQASTATQIISFCYDALNRVTGKAYGSASCPLSSPVVTYTYDAGTNGIGHLTSLTDQAGSAGYSYDVLGRLSSETRTINGVTKNLSYSYNLDGSLASVTYPSGRQSRTRRIQPGGFSRWRIPATASIT